jgi:4-hydroxy-tetrahydrodipicolinate synthase
MTAFLAGQLLGCVFMQTALNATQANQANQANQATTDFSGLWIPLVTPFDRAKVDYAALKRLVAHYRASGIAGLVVCGSTGEAAALSDDEQLEVLQTAMAEAPGLPVIMGLSGYHLGKTAARVRALSQLDLTGILLPAPSYIRPSQAGLIEWFAALADASAVPVVLYDIPYRTGSKMELETIRQPTRAFGRSKTAAAIRSRRRLLLPTGSCRCWRARM